MKVPMSVLNLIVGVPAIVASTLLWVVALALMPPMFGLAGSLIGIVALGLVAAGLGERVAVPLLARARELTAAEQAVLAPVLAHVALSGSDVDSRRLLVRKVVTARTWPAELLGREHVVVAQWMIEATHRGGLSLDQVTALIVHAVGRHRAEGRRGEVAMLVWTLPWHGGAALVRGIGRVAGWFPIIRFAWAFRGGIGVVALVQQIDEGRPALGVLAGSIVALTYLVPAANGAKAHQVEVAGDDAVARHGLGQSMLSLLAEDAAPHSIAGHSEAAAPIGRQRIRRRRVAASSRGYRDTRGPDDALSKGGIINI